MPYHALFKNAKANDKAPIRELLKSYETACSVATYEGAGELMRKLQAVITLINETHHDTELPAVRAKVETLLSQLEALRDANTDPEKRLTLSNPSPSSSKNRAKNPKDRAKLTGAIGFFIGRLHSIQTEITRLLHATSNKEDQKRSSPPQTPAPITIGVTTPLLPRARSSSSEDSSGYGAIHGEVKNTIPPSPLLRESRTAFIPDYLLRRTFEKSRYHSLVKKPFLISIGRYFIKTLSQFILLLSLVIPTVYYGGKLAGLLWDPTWIKPVMIYGSIATFALIVAYVISKYRKGELWDLRTPADLSETDKIRFNTTLNTAEPSIVNDLTREIRTAREQLEKLNVKQKELVDQNGRLVEESTSISDKIDSLVKKLQRRTNASPDSIAARASASGITMALAEQATDTVPPISTTTPTEEEKTASSPALPTIATPHTPSFLPGYYSLIDETNPASAIQELLNAYQKLCSISKRRTYPGLPHLLRQLEYAAQLLNQTYAAEELPKIRLQITSLLAALEEISTHNLGATSNSLDEHRALTNKDRNKVTSTINVFKKHLAIAKEKITTPPQNSDYIRQNHSTHIVEEKMHEAFEKGKPHCVVKMTFREAIGHYLANKLVLMTFITVISSIITIIYYAGEIAIQLNTSSIWPVAITSGICFLALTVYPIGLYLAGRIWEFITPPDAVKSENLRFTASVVAMSATNLDPLRNELAGLRKEIGEVQLRNQSLGIQNQNSQVNLSKSKATLSSLERIEKEHVTGDINSGRLSLGSPTPTPTASSTPPTRRTQTPNRSIASLSSSLTPVSPLSNISSAPTLPSVQGTRHSRLTMGLGTPVATGGTNPSIATTTTAPQGSTNSLPTTTTATSSQ